MRRQVTWDVSLKPGTASGLFRLLSGCPINPFEWMNEWASQAEMKAYEKAQKGEGTGWGWGSGQDRGRQSTWGPYHSRLIWTACLSWWQLKSTSDCKVQERFQVLFHASICLILKTNLCPSFSLSPGSRGNKPGARFKHLLCYWKVQSQGSETEGEGREGRKKEEKESWKWLFIQK